MPRPEHRKQRLLLDVGSICFSCVLELIMPCSRWYPLYPPLDQ